MALDIRIRNLAEEKIRVNIIEAEVNSCNNLYGCIAFNSFYFPFDESNGINLECGNIIINTKLNKNKNDWRFTLARIYTKNLQIKRKVFLNLMKDSYHLMIRYNKKIKK